MQDGSLRLNISVYGGTECKMKSLKSIIYSSLRKLAFFVMVFILLSAVFLQIFAVQKQAKENAEATFLQIEQILQKNTSELETIESDYRRMCLLNAETISYIIQHNPDILGNTEEFRQLAKMMQVDEIHIFDDTGRIFSGTHPEYFDFTFDSGEQMNFFKPMMKNKRLRLCQDITPNTAEGRLVQYSALWSTDFKFIVQVGMYPDAVLEMTEKNELSYIFSLLQGNPGVSLYAFDLVSGEIVGSTSGVDNGKNLTAIGFSYSDLEECPKGKHMRINGVDSYAIFENMASTVIGYVISSDKLYETVVPYSLVLGICLLVITAVLVLMVRLFTEHYIIGGIRRTNEKLRAVSDGNLGEKVDERNSLEFSELSNHINHMIHTLLADADKMSFIIDRANMKIGVYEYNTKKKTVSFTEHVQDIFVLSKEKREELLSDLHTLQRFIADLKKDAVPGMEKTYRYVGEKEIFVKLEEVWYDSDAFGVVVDVTEDVLKLRSAELERDSDSLTGLYNRRGMERRLEQLFNGNENLKSGAMIVIDSDDMKGVNDNFGHHAGDVYLKCHAEILKDFPAPYSVAARIGGDEFVLFIYGYENDEAVNDAVALLRKLQDEKVLVLEDKTKIPLRFSFGYQMTRGRRDYDKMIASADEYMYNSKRIRKKLAKGMLQ